MKVFRGIKPRAIAMAVNTATPTHRRNGSMAGAAIEGLLYTNHVVVLRLGTPGTFRLLPEGCTMAA